MTRYTQAIAGLPEEVAERLRELGSHIRSARKIRRLNMVDLARRALTSRETLRRLERGEPGVSIGTLAHVLWVLGLSENLGNLASLKVDAHGLARLELDLPKRIKRRKESQYDF